MQTPPSLPSEVWTLIVALTSVTVGSILTFLITLITSIRNERIQEKKDREKQYHTIRDVANQFILRYPLHSDQLVRLRALHRPFRGEASWFSEQLSKAISAGTKVDPDTRERASNMVILLGKFHNWIEQNILDEVSFIATDAVIDEFTRLGESITNDARKLIGHIDTILRN